MKADLAERLANRCEELDDPVGSNPANRRLPTTT